MESVTKATVETLKILWENSSPFQLVTVVVILLIAMRFKSTRRFLVEMVEKSTGFQVPSATFEEKAAEKTRRIIKEAKKQNDTITRCQGELARVAQSGCIVEKGMIKKWKGIDSEEKFNEIVTNVGEMLGFPEESVTEIRLTAFSDSYDGRLLDFDAKLKDGGSIRLHTGSYQVRKTGENKNNKFDLEIAIGYIDMKEIVLRKIPELKDQVATWGAKGGDWNMFLEYKAHTVLANHYDSDINI